MYFYFCSNHPVAMKINGTYFATLGNDVIPCDLQEEIPPLIEICTLNDAGRCFAFFPNESFLCAPPENVSVTNLKGGYLIKFYHILDSGKFGIYSQFKQQNLTATIFNDGGNKLSIETLSDFYIEKLDFSLTNLNFNFYFPEQFNQKLLIICFSGNSDRLVVYNIENKITKIFEREVQGFSLESGFSTYERLKDIAKHSITTFWGLENNVLKPTNKKIDYDLSFNPTNLNDKVIPFAFLEEFAVGGKFLDYLCDNIKQNAQKLGGFFGDFIGVMPPPLFRNINEVGLVYNIKENLYKVEYFSFQVENKKITGIKKCD